MGLIALVTGTGNANSTLVQFHALPVLVTRAINPLVARLQRNPSVDICCTVGQYSGCALIYSQGSRPYKFYSLFCTSAGTGLEGPGYEASTGYMAVAGLQIG